MCKVNLSTPRILIYVFALNIYIQQRKTIGHFEKLKEIFYHVTELKKTLREKKALFEE